MIGKKPLVDVHFGMKEIQMKRRLAPIITMTAALILISSLTYAAVKKKEKAKSDVRAPEVTEEETLKAELLEGTGEQQKKLTGTDNSRKNPAEAVPSQKIARQRKK